MDQSQTKERCSSGILTGTGSLHGFRFVINKRGVATIEPVASGKVWGVLWSITESDERALDGYEGVEAGHYNKSNVSVRGSTGSLISALVYVASDSTPGKPRQGYLEKILAAAEAHELPGDYIEELKSWLTRD
jgi:gamma-glutamylcyclotransferase (GGCT)/AIG2-like uncharacterized protein YtfP